MTAVTAGLIVLYRWRIADDDIERFRQCWATATEDLRGYGAMGSLLAKDAVGDYWAIAQWRDHHARERAEAEYPDPADWPNVERLDTVMLDPIENRWA
ncbi:MAG: hypothetical protein WA948_10105 [Pontixanthobacter sp.]